MAKNLLVPGGTEVYPGTDAPGYIAHLSRAPILLPGHVEQRPLIGIDFGQKYHAVAVYAHRPSVHQSLLQRQDQLNQQLQLGLITQPQFINRMHGATQAFKATERRLNNAHTQRCILATRHNQQGKVLRKNEHAACVNQNRPSQSAQSRINDLAGHRHVYKGSSSASIYQENLRMARHQQPLDRFYKKRHWLEKSNTDAQLATQSYFPRAAAYLANKISARAFYFDKSPLIKGNREVRKKQLDGRRDTTSKAPRKRWNANPPLIATGTDGTANGNWAAGQPPARGLVSSSGRFLIRLSNPCFLANGQALSRHQCHCGNGTRNGNVDRRLDCSS